jgi:hypothetical protein
LTLANPITSFTGYFTYSEPLTIDAFNSSFTLVASATSEFSDNEALSGDPGNSPNEFIHLGFAAGISSLTITGDPLGGSFTLDDTTYNSGISTVPEPKTLPMVFIALVTILLRSPLIRFARNWRQLAASVQACLLLAQARPTRGTARRRYFRDVTMSHGVRLFCLCCGVLLAVSNPA